MIVTIFCKNITSKITTKMLTSNIPGPGQIIKIDNTSIVTSTSES